MKPNHLIIISYDAMVYEDLSSLENLPCFSRFYQSGSRIKRMRSIYPSLTYPAHVSILTGVTPGVHGIVNNEPSIPGKTKCPWYWFHDPVKVPDLHNLAHAAGLTTASVFWPVSGCHPEIDYLVAEYWPQSPGETQETAHLRAGTRQSLYDEIVRSHEEDLSDWQPAGFRTDEAKTAIACDIITRHKPDLLTLHLGQIDSCRHRYGLFNDKVTDAVLRSEQHLSRIVAACQAAGIYENTNFVIVSDHGQLHYSRRMNLNTLFARHGLIKTDSEGNFLSASVWAKSANFCAQIHISDPSDQALTDRVYQILRSAQDDAIKTIYTAPEAREKFGLFGDFSFVIESDEQTIFTSEFNGPLFQKAEPVSPGYLRASHGHDPSAGPQPVFLAAGPDIKPGIVLETGSLIDEAPTFASLLNLRFSDIQGHPITQLFN